MIYIIKILFVISTIYFEHGFSQSCPPQDTINVVSSQDLWDLEYLNSWPSLEVISWNLENFPSTSYTVDYVQEIISDMMPDVILFQEINSLTDFYNLAELLPAYEFHDSNQDLYNLGFAARKDCIEVNSVSTSIISSSQHYYFAYRPPMKVDFTWSCGLAGMNFSAINVHLKCCNDGFERRLESAQILSDYINANLDQNIIIGGDFNDEITDPQQNNSLWPLVESDNAYFVTTNISTTNYYNTFISGSFIDHILITPNLFSINQNSIVETLRLDDMIGGYELYISDHRPLFYSIYIPEIEFSQGLVINEIMHDPDFVSDNLGEWFEVTNISDEDISLNGLIIQDSESDFHIINDNQSLIVSPGEYFVFGKSNDMTINGAIHIDYVLSDFNLSNFIDQIIIKHPSNNIIDQIEYNIFEGTFESESGYSMMLLDPQLDNEIGSNWTLSTQMIANSTDYGSPGQPNIVSDCVNNGDINSDEITNILDIVQMVSFVLGDSELSELQICIGNINSDSTLNILDIVQLVQLLLD